MKDTDESDSFRLLSKEEALRIAAENGNKAGTLLAKMRQYSPGWDKTTRRIWETFQEGMDLIVFDDDLEVIYWIREDVKRSIERKEPRSTSDHLQKALEWCHRHKLEIPFDAVNMKFSDAFQVCQRIIC